MNPFQSVKLSLVVAAAAMIVVALVYGASTGLFLWFLLVVLTTVLTAIVLFSFAKATSDIAWRMANPTSPATNILQVAFKQIRNRLPTKCQSGFDRDPAGWILAVFAIVLIVMTGITIVFAIWGLGADTAQTLMNTAALVGMLLGGIIAYFLNGIANCYKT